MSDKRLNKIASALYRQWKQIAEIDRHSKILKVMDLIENLIIKKQNNQNI